MSIRDFFKKHYLLIPCVLLAADIALLIVIISSCSAQKAAQPAYEKTWRTEQATEKTTVTEQTQNTETPDISTAERPTDADFLEWFAKDVMWYGVPQGVDKINDLSLVTGSWKGLIYYDPENVMGSEAVELLNFTVDGNENALTLTADWYSIYYVQDGEGVDETDMEDVVFAGTWDNGALCAEGAASIRFTDFYTQDGRQYAVGEMNCANGIYAKVAMVRP